MIYIFLDKSVWPFDPAWYGEVSLSLSVALKGSLHNWIHEMVHAFGTKAPLIAWIGQFLAPIGRFGVPIEWPLLMIPISSWIISSILIYLIACKAWPESRLPALVAILVCMTAPVVLGLSRMYFVECVQLLPITCLIYLPMVRRNRAELVLWSIVITSFALLAKNTTPMHCVAPGLVVLFLLCRPSKELLSKKKLLAVSLVSITSLLLCFSWYYINWSIQLEFIKSASGGSIGLAYGSRAPFIQKLNFWIPQFQKAFFLQPIFYLFVFCLVYALVKTLYSVTRSRISLGAIVGILAMTQAVIQLSLLSLQVVEEPRYLATMLPFVALSAAFVVSQVNTIITLVLLMGLVYQGVVCSLFSFGAIKDLQVSNWLHPVEYSTLDQDLLNFVIANTCPENRKNMYHIIGQEMPSFNANSALFYSLKPMVLGEKEYRCFYTSLGYASTDSEASWKRINDLGAYSVIFRNDFQGAELNNPFNVVNAAIEKRLSESSDFTLESNPSIPHQLTYFHRVTTEPNSGN